jgi:hypothetical protein
VISKSQVSDIIRRKTYYGFIDRGDIQAYGNFEPLIDKQLYDRANQYIATHKAVFKPRISKGRKPTSHFFNGLIKCGVRGCGCSVCGDSKKGGRFIYYHCGSKHKGNAVRIESLIQQGQAIVDQVVLTHKQFSDIKTFLKSSISKGRSELQKKEDTIKRNIGVLEKRISQLYYDKSDNKISEDFWQKETYKQNSDLIKAKEALVAIQNNMVNYDQNLDAMLKVLSLTKTLHSQYKEGDNMKRAGILRLVLSNCQLLDRKLIPIYRKPFEYLAQSESQPGEQIKKPNVSWASLIWLSVQNDTLNGTGRILLQQAEDLKLL